MDARRVVTAVIRFKEKILLLKRAPNRGYHASKWENVGGGIEENENLEDALMREVFEETGLKGKIVRPGEDFDVIVDGRAFHVYPFLFEVLDDNVKLSTEHTEYRWIDVNEFVNFDCVNEIEVDFKNLGLL